jgi:oligopeptidase A
MTRAKNFQTAMQMIRQLEFALFDFRLHMEFDEQDPICIQRILNEVREKISVIPAPDFNRFQHSFAHIFSGGYAAGYYSYKWAEVMACDIFSLFEEKGIFDSETSKKFKETFLESGGAKDPMDLFTAFRGRKPTVDALLQQNGII